MRIKWNKQDREACAKRCLSILKQIKGLDLNFHSVCYGPSSGITFIYYINDKEAQKEYYDEEVIYVTTFYTDLARCLDYLHQNIMERLNLQEIKGCIYLDSNKLTRKQILIRDTYIIQEIWQTVVNNPAYKKMINLNLVV